MRRPGSGRPDFSLGFKSDYRAGGRGTGIAVVGAAFLFSVLPLVEER